MRARKWVAVLAIVIVTGLSYYAFVMAPTHTTGAGGGVGSAPSQILVLDTTLSRPNGSFTFPIARNISTIRAIGFANRSIGNISLVDASQHPEVHLQFNGGIDMIATAHITSDPPYVLPEPGNWTCTFSFTASSGVHLEVWYTPA